jgi:hypothetical protein
MIIDTLWSSDPANPDLSMTYSPIERGDSLLIVNEYENKYLAVIGPTGKTVRIVGRAGEGPGEYRSISAIDAGADGRVHVFDRRRLTVLDSALDVSFTTVLPAMVEKGALLDDGTAVVAGTRYDGDSLFALQHIGTDGGLLNSFDPVTGPTNRFIARGRDNTVWAATFHDETPAYELHRWDPRTGVLVQTIRDSPPWFRWSPRELSGNRLACQRGDRSACARAEDEPRPPHPPAPRIFHMWETHDGLLWIISYTADPRWREAAPSESHRVFDSVLEARDAVTGRLIMERTFDQALTGFTNRGHIMMFELGADDQPRHTLISVSLTRSSKGRRE